MEESLLDQVLEDCRDKRVEASVSLRDGSTINGKVKNFDAYVILVEGSPDIIVYRHSVLKLGEKPARAAVNPAPARVERFTPRPAAQAERPKKDQRRPRREPTETQPQKPAGPQEQFNPMAAAMEKWLKGQK